MRKVKSGPVKGKKKSMNHASTPSIKKTIKMQFKDKIRTYEQYHKEDAEKWSAKQSWDGWQDEFEQKTSQSKFCYPSIYEFAEEKAKGNDKIERWILKSIGPKPKKEITWKGDWALERAFNKSNESIAVRKIEDKIKQNDDIKALLLPVAQDLESWRIDVDHIRMKVLEVLEGEIIESKPKKGFKTEEEKYKWGARQRERLDFYQTWIERLFEYKEKVDSLYLKALGVDILGKNSNVMEAMFARIMMGNGHKNPAGLPASTAVDEDLEKKVWMDAITMEIAKARSFDMELPDEYKPVAKVLTKHRIIDVDKDAAVSKE